MLSFYHAFHLWSKVTRLKTTEGCLSIGDVHDEPTDPNITI
jgi:hypothetical protein